MYPKDGKGLYIGGGDLVVETKNSSTSSFQNLKRPKTQ